MYLTLTAPKTVKEGIRQTLRKQKLVHLTNSILGLRVEAGQLMNDLQPYVLGAQLQDGMRVKACADLGRLLAHASNAAKLLKVKVPSSHKKVKPTATITGLLVRMDSVAGTLLQDYYEVYQGKTLDVEKIKTHLSELMPLIQQFSWAALNTSLAEVMASHVKTISGNYPDGFFNPPPKKAAPKSPPPRKQKAEAPGAPVAAQASAKAPATPRNLKINAPKA